MKCSHCGSKTPKIVKLREFRANTKENITIDGYAVSVKKPIYQCQNKSCKYAFNVDE